ncbi:MAG: AAA family ATPase, partial [candidate division Zixibacteria bacterium 4484_93]
MLTKIKIKNFKVFEDVEIELDNPVVFIGPNNSGKTTALQALSLWEIGLKRWVEKRGGKTIPKERKGVTIYRPELVSLPVDMAKVLWHKLHVRELSFDDGRQKTKNVFITICVEGITDNKEWQFGLDFYYSNDQVFYCRPIATEDGIMKV